MSGCGRLEKIAQPAACQTGTTRGTSTSAIATPVGARLSRYVPENFVQGRLPGFD